MLLRPRIIYCHGKLDHPYSKKAKIIQSISWDHGLDVIVPDFTRNNCPDRRASHLIDYLNISGNNTKTIYVGSNMGAYCALVTSQIVQPDAMFLMSPTIGLPGYKQKNPLGKTRKGLIYILHGKKDRIVSLKNVLEYANQYDCCLELVDDDHSLHDSENLIRTSYQKFLSQAI